MIFTIPSYQSRNSIIYGFEINEQVFEITRNYLKHLTTQLLDKKNNGLSANTIDFLSTYLKKNWNLSSCLYAQLHIEMFYLNSILNFGIPPVLVF